MNILLTAMDKIRLGLPQTRLEDSPAKKRMATVEVGRAVALALTPGMPPIENLSIKPRGGVMGRILFQPQVSTNTARGTHFDVLHFGELKHYWSIPACHAYCRYVVLFCVPTLL